MRAAAAAGSLESISKEMRLMKEVLEGRAKTAGRALADTSAESGRGFNLCSSGRTWTDLDIVETRSRTLPEAHWALLDAAPRVVHSTTS